MSGYTKNMYEKNINEIQKNFTAYVRSIIPILPCEYDKNILIALVKEYYPFEYQVLEEQYRQYKKHDEKLIKIKGRSRFSMQAPVDIICNLSISRVILSDGYMQNHANHYQKECQERNIHELKKIRDSKIKKKQDKVDKAISKTQQTEPEFLDTLMGLYERKNTSQEDRVYIMLELQKYYCPKVVNFFQKRAHSEYNFQLREMAVQHLHSMGHYAVLRKQKYMVMHTKNKKRRKFLKNEYAKAKFNIRAIPTELEYRIDNNSKEQRIKTFDYFISHSSIDYKEVQSLIYNLNMKKKNIYCDWINDTDYLKRNLVSDATLKVIKKRIEQSKAVLFVQSENSINSKWVKYELNYCYQLAKPIYIILKKDIADEKFNISELKEKWFIDENYEEENLY